MDRSGPFEVVGEYAERVVDGETILVPIRSHVKDLESIFTMNPAATVLWREIRAGRTLAEATGTLVEEFGVDRSTAETDAREFIDALLERGLIRDSEP